MYDLLKLIYLRYYLYFCYFYLSLLIDSAVREKIYSNLNIHVQIDVYYICLEEAKNFYWTKSNKWKYVKIKSWHFLETDIWYHHIIRILCHLGKVIVILKLFTELSVTIYFTNIFSHSKTYASYLDFILFICKLL